MDLRAYYRKLREVENTLEHPFVVVVSLETPDGGRAGILTEVPKYTAAQLIIEAKARVATFDEENRFRQANAEAKEAADNARAISTMQFVVLPSKATPSKSPRD